MLSEPDNIFEHAHIFFSFQRNGAYNWLPLPLPIGLVIKSSQVSVIELRPKMHNRHRNRSIDMFGGKNNNRDSNCERLDFKTNSESSRLNSSNFSLCSKRNMLKTQSPILRNRHDMVNDNGVIIDDNVVHQ